MTVVFVFEIDIDCLFEILCIFGDIRILDITKGQRYIKKKGPQKLKQTGLRTASCDLFTYK